MMRARWWILGAAIGLAACERTPGPLPVEVADIVAQPRPEFVTLHGRLAMHRERVMLMQLGDSVRLENVGAQCAKEHAGRAVAVAGRWHYGAFYVNELADEGLPAAAGCAQP